jgi:hypothetical protein
LKANEITMLVFCFEFHKSPTAFELNGANQNVLRTWRVISYLSRVLSDLKIFLLAEVARQGDFFLYYSPLMWRDEVPGRVRIFVCVY